MPTTLKGVSAESKRQNRGLFPLSESMKYRHNSDDSSVMKVQEEPSPPKSAGAFSPLKVQKEPYFKSQFPEETLIKGLVQDRERSICIQENLKSRSS